MSGWQVIKSQAELLAKFRAKTFDDFAMNIFNGTFKSVVVAPLTDGIKIELANDLDSDFYRSLRYPFSFDDFVNAKIEASRIAATYDNRW